MEIKNGTKYILADVKKCLGCRCCQQACGDANGNSPYWETLGLGLPLNWQINVLEFFLEDKNYPLMAQMVCRQCEDAPCVKICPVKAISVNEEGVKIISNQRCIGCHNCIMVCPFGAIHIAGGVAAKCTLCLERKGAKGQSACVEACPNQALKLVDTKELIREKGEKMIREGYF